MRGLLAGLLALFFCIAGGESPEVCAQAVKGQTMRTHTIVLGKRESKVPGKPPLPVIGFVASLPYENSGPETRAAFDHLKSITSFEVQYLTYDDLARRSKKINKLRILWIHRSDTTPLTKQEQDPDFLGVLQSYLQQGGRVLLTQQAFHLIHTLGLEPGIPRDSTKVCKDNGYGRKLGLHAFREHPVFNGLNGGAYIQWPQRDIATRVTGFFGKEKPLNGKVIGADWDYIILREDSKLMVEYNSGNGQLVAVGGYMMFAEPNRNRLHLELFTNNLFDYLDGKFDGRKAFYWDYAPGEVFECAPVKPESDRMILAVPEGKPWPTDNDPLTIERQFASENFWDVAGERLVSMGVENGGIEEIWSHPFMALRDYDVGIRFSNKDSIFWLQDERPEIQVHPAFFLRQYKFQRGYLKEIILNDPTAPSGVVHYEYRGLYKAELIIRFKSNLRWMWPYTEKITGSVCYAWDGDLNAFNIRDKSDDLNVMIGANREPLSHLSGHFEQFGFDQTGRSHSGVPTEKLQAAFLLVYELKLNDNLDVVYTASDEGYFPTLKQFEVALRDPYAIFNRAEKASQKVLDEHLVITTPDKDFNLGYRWALLGTNRFFVHTPGMGKALVAGYSTTRHGWDGGHRISGRPGYAWYFGRDAEWSSFALLDYGDFEKVKDQLKFFQKYQDLNGKIFHEATTSGFIHYDAADATPLYLVLAGKYFLHSNDTAFIRRSWPNIRKAIVYCFSTDTDQDHLIENTNVGHGWVEGGKLYGSHSTIYMAGSWAAALSEARNMALFMKDTLATRLETEAGAVKKIINDGFWDEATGFFGYGKNLDGTYRLEPTILPAVPLYFKMADKIKAQACLKQFAGNAFSTNWGSRIIRDDSPYFRPSGYHYGSVWPLFTGWSALAEYEYGNHLQGYSHIMNNLKVYKNWGLGFVEEVLNGAEYQPSGVCAHQCWSETMVLQPAIEGMLGLGIFAQKNKITLAPRLPFDWDSLDVSNIRIENRRAGFSFHRGNGSYTYDFHLDSGKPVNLDFFPALPAGSKVTGVMLDGREAPFTVFKTDQFVNVLVNFELANSQRLVIQCEKGVGMLSLVQEPKPGDPAAGTRIISTALKGDDYIVVLEGLPGTTITFRLYLDDQEIETVFGGSIKSFISPIAEIETTFVKETGKYSSNTVRIQLKQR